MTLGIALRNLKEVCLEKIIFIIHRLIVQIVIKHINVGNHLE